MIIQYAERVVNETLNDFFGSEGKDFVIAIDTDSLYINVSDIVNHYSPKNPTHFLDELAKKLIEPKLAKAFNDLADRHGAFENRMEMSREVIADRGIWTAKKRYILNVLDNEGVRYAKPKVKMMGIEAIKSSTPQVCRDEMKRMFSIIMTSNEKTVQAEIAAFKEKFFTLDPHEIGRPSSVSNVKEYMEGAGYKKGTPINSRAAIVFNAALKRHNLTNKYRQLYNGDKLKYVFLKTPNPVGQNVIAFSEDTFPPEIGLRDYIDYEMQFEKTYIQPLESVLHSIGWSCEAVASLEDFFC